jgi:hypothetical protein
MANVKERRNFHYTVVDYVQMGVGVGLVIPVVWNLVNIPEDPSFMYLVVMSTAALFAGMFLKLPGAREFLSAIVNKFVPKPVKELPPEDPEK